MRSNAVEAWVNDAWNVLATQPPASWSADDVELAVALIRPARIELSELLEDEGIGTTAQPWRAFADGTRLIVNEGLTLPEAWFSIGMAIDEEQGSSHWSWTAIALTPDRALLCERSDRYGSPAFPHPFGLISYDNMFKSAALLMANRRHRGRDYFAPGRFLDEIHSSDIPDPELYRILAAASGHGGAGLIHMDRAGLPHFRTPDMEFGFADVLRRLDAHM